MLKIYLNMQLSVSKEDILKCDVDPDDKLKSDDIYIRVNYRVYHGTQYLYCMLSVCRNNLCF